jgi:hypothetical protein
MRPCSLGKLDGSGEEAWLERLAGVRRVVTPGHHPQPTGRVLGRLRPLAAHAVEGRILPENDVSELRSDCREFSAWPPAHIGDGQPASAGVGPK